MAIAPTGDIFKSLTFDNTSSRSYGVYITGEAVYNAPERDVEMVTIAGRNGAYALDNGRFENITVSYPAGIFADTEADFVQAISDFRNFLCSKKGYCRLTDEYNPKEYRMAIYKSGLEVTPAQRAGEFNIVFECKPQRFLTSGETAVIVANNDTLTNPTLFEASPLLEVTGYGEITFNGYEINIKNEPVGDVVVEGFNAVQAPAYIDLSGVKFATGDQIEAAGVLITVSIEYPDTVSAATLQSWSGDASAGPFVAKQGKKTGVYFEFIDPLTFTAGTSSYYSITATVKTTYGGGLVDTKTIVVRATYDWSTKKIKLQLWSTSTSTGQKSADATAGNTTIHSTAVGYGQPTYIDCDLGEAYYIENGEAFSLNQYIDLGSELPVLAPNTNAFTKNNTITQLKVVPRWWKV